MEYLPAEIYIKIFKDLNFDEIFSLKQTNKYFCDFINKYKGSFARKRFGKLTFTSNPYYAKLKGFRKLKLESIDFPFSNHLQEKWLSAVDKQIPIFLNIESSTPIGINQVISLLFHPEGQGKDILYLKLPIFPQNIEEFMIVRYWLEQIFICDFEYLSFETFIFNTEMILFLFDDDEIAKFKFNCQMVELSFNNKNFDAWKFIFEHLIINGYILICLTDRWGQEPSEDNKILLNLLLNEGDRIHKVILSYEYKDATLYNLLINHLETSTDLSKMVANVMFISCEEWLRSKLTVRGVEMHKSVGR